MQYLNADAVISPCGRFRYMLSRRWGNDQRQVLWVMLNPSIADGLQDDPTVRKCVGFSSRWGYEALAVVNLFAFRATAPCDLKAAGYLEGTDNEEIVKSMASGASLIIAAWGANAPSWRDDGMRKLLAGHDVKCLGKTDKGIPRHPLMIAYSTQLEPLCAS